MTTSTFVNLKRRTILRVFHSGIYSEGAQVIDFNDERLRRRPLEVDVIQLNELLHYWSDFGEELDWCSSEKHLHESMR